MSDATNTDEILADTQGNKTLAASVQKAAETASKRAAQVHNVTVAIRDAILAADSAFEEAKTTLDTTAKSNEEISSSLESTEADVAALEEKARETAERIGSVHNKTDKLKAEYIKITSNSRAAARAADVSAEIAQGVADKQAALQTKYDEVERQLEQHVSGNEERKERAQRLHQRTTELLTQIHQHNAAADSR